VNFGLALQLSVFLAKNPAQNLLPGVENSFVSALFPPNLTMVFYGVKVAVGVRKWLEVENSGIHDFELVVDG
jgi:hypothetical protein